MNGRVFRGTTDGRLLALDANTGQLIWKDVVGDPTIQENVSGVPLAWNGLVIAGTTGDEGGIKGRIMAFDAVTGRELWRFTTIPTGNEVGADTWESKQTAETGGGGTWSTFTLDVTTGELFVPVGSPAPGFAPEYRPGANLFTCSFVVLDARTGALKWWYQLVHNDGHDLDLSAAPMLYTNSEGRNVVAAAGKDGYVHAVDRLTHKVLFKTAVTTIENENLRPSEKETKFCPSSLGGTEWNGPAFDYTSETIFVGAVDYCVIVKSTGEKHFIRRPGAPWSMGVTWVTSAGTNDPPRGWLSALDADTGKIKWQYHSDSALVAGVTATAGGIVLTGDTAGNFLVFDSAKGQLLYKKDTGGGIAGGVITYAVVGKQYIAFTSGNGSSTYFGHSGPPSIVVMALDEKTRSEASSNVAHGRELYAANCSVCHGANGEGRTGKSLVNLKDRQSLDATIQWLENPKPPMPKLFPSPLSEKDLRSIATFIRKF